jgi:hypothetical protein
MPPGQDFIGIAEAGIATSGEADTAAGSGAAEGEDGRDTMTNDYSYVSGTSNPCDQMVIRIGDVVVFGDVPAGVPANW